MSTTLELLTALGSSADEVAANLLKAGIKGVKKNCIFCPITNYLRGEGIPMDIGYLISDYPQLQPIRSFIMGFDNGKYSELDEQATV